MSHRRLRPATRAVVALALVAWMALLAFMLLSPSAAAPTSLVLRVAAIAEEVGVPSALTETERVEFALNVVAFMPASFLGALLWSRLSWRDWTAYAFVTSFTVEVVQAVLLDQRSATHSDVVANTLGGLAGAVLGVAVMLVAGTEHRSRDGGSEGRADLSDRPSPAQQRQLPG